MKRPINGWMIASMLCFVVAATLTMLLHNWILFFVAVGFQFCIFGFEWADRGTLKDFFRK